MTRWRIDLHRLDDLRLSLGLLFPVAAGVLLYGFRAVGVWALIFVGALLTRAVLWRLRTWTATPGRLSLLVRAIVIGLFCPATLFDPERSFLQPTAAWPALIGLGVLLALADWFVRLSGTRRLHPVVVTAAVLTLVLPSLTDTRRVLRPDDLAVGDVFDARSDDRPAATATPWLELPPDHSARVLDMTPPTQPLQDFLRRLPPPGRRTQTVARLVSDDLPPLEDLVVGGHPASIGQGSVVALLIGGLFLVYRRVTPLRVPALALLACYAALIVLPLPVVADGVAGRRWLFERDPRVGWAAGLTLVHYLLTASPVVLTGLFLATQPGVRPDRKWPAAAFAIVFGLLAAAATVFVSVGGGAVLALLIVQGLWPWRKPSGSLSRYAGRGDLTPASSAALLTAAARRGS